MKQILFLFLLLCSVSVYGQRYCLQAGHRVSIIVLDELNSQKPAFSPSAVVAGDVYDDQGRKILIPKGTPVLLQVHFRKASLTGDVGQITITPVSTQAINGREITFVAEPIVFEGNDNDFFRSQKKVIIAARTALVASVANTYCFKVQSPTTN